MKTVLVQKGHAAPREPGFESGTGTVGEQALVSKIADRLAVLLRVDGRFHVMVVPGDIPNGVKCDAALFLHADGSSNPRASGFSFGYPQGYPVNRRLADLVAAEFMRLPGHPPHHADNYTGGLRGYYGFSRVNTAGPEVVVEHGFMTNPGERRWLEANVSRLAGAEYQALLRFFGLPAIRPPKPTPKRQPDYMMVVEESDGKVGRVKVRWPRRTLAVANSLRRNPKSIELTRL